MKLENAVSFNSIKVFQKSKFNYNKALAILKISYPIFKIKSATEVINPNPENNNVNLAAPFRVP